MARRGPRVVRADDAPLPDSSMTATTQPSNDTAAATNTTTTTTSASASFDIPTLDIFDKFQHHRDDFDSHWLMLEDDVPTTNAVAIPAAVRDKLERHKSHLDVMRQAGTGAGTHGRNAHASTTTTSNTAATTTATSATAVTHDDDGDARMSALPPPPRKRAREMPLVAPDTADDESDDDNDSDDDEYQPGDATAPRQRARSDTDTSTTATTTATTTAATTAATSAASAADGMTGDYMHFLPKASAHASALRDDLTAGALQATVTVPATASSQSAMLHGRRGGGGDAGRADDERVATTRRRRRNNNNSSSEHSDSASPPPPPASRQLNVPLWSVRRMQQYGGYCRDSDLVALHQEITDLYDYLRPTQSEISVRRYLELEVCRLARELWPQCEAVVYGSLYTHLLLPLSDVDITLLHVPVAQEEALTALARAIAAAGLCHDLYPQLILKTRIPLVKFRHAGSRIDVDISIDAADGKDNSVQVVRLLRACPAARALTLVVKYFLQQRDMHEPYHGGLGSYATTLLVLSFLQQHPIYTTHPEQRAYTGLGKLLVDFFRYYGYYWNYSRVGVSLAGVGDNSNSSSNVVSGGYFRRTDNITTNNNNSNNSRGATTASQPGSPTRPPLGPPQALIIDPGKPTNNAASSLRIMHSIASAFAHAYLALTASFGSNNNNNNNGNNDETAAVLSHDAVDIARRPTLLSRILHVDAEMVYRRQNIAATYDELCRRQPERMAEVRAYRRHEDAPMLYVDGRGYHEHVDDDNSRSRSRSDDDDDDDDASVRAYKHVQRRSLATVAAEATAAAAASSSSRRHHRDRSPSSPSSSSSVSVSSNDSSVRATAIRRARRG